MGAGDGAIFSRESVDVDGVRLSYLEGGTQRDLDPVLYLHGMGGGGKWESFNMAMGTVTRTIAPILPGWQDGELPDGVSAPKDYTSLLVKFLDGLGLDRVTVVGHSIGGWLAQYLAVEQPERCSQLVLIGAMGLDVPDAPAADLGALDEESFGKATFAKLGLVAAAQPDGFGAVWADLREGPEFEREWEGRNLVMQLLRDGSADPELSARLKDVHAKTLLVWGKLDGIVPCAQAEAAHSWLPGSQLELIDQAGHLPMFDRRETMNRLIHDFLNAAAA